MSRPQQVSTCPEEILQEAMHACEALQVGGRLEPPHLTLRLAGRLVGDFGSIVRVLVRRVDERLVAAKTIDPVARLVVILGGDAGLRCGEMIALEWGDLDLAKPQFCVQRSDWNGHVTVHRPERRMIPVCAADGPPRGGVA